MKERDYRIDDHFDAAANEDVPDAVDRALSDLPEDEQVAIRRLWADLSVLRAREPSATRLSELGNSIWEALEPQLHAPVRPLRGATGARIYPLPGVRRWGLIAATFLVLAVAGILYAHWPRTVTAPLGERLTIDLPDGSAVDLNSGASLTYSPRTFSWLSRSARLEGEAYFDVTRSGSTFHLRTFNAEIVVLGTSFNVRAWKNEPSPSTSVTLYRGKVRVANASEPAFSVELSPGQMSRVSTQSHRPSPPRTTDLQQTAAWRTGRFVFIDEPLSTILMEMERRFAVEIRVDGQHILHDRLTLSYEDPGSPDAILEDIASSYSRYGYLRTAEGYELFVAPAP